MDLTVLNHISYGMYVIATRNQQQDVGCFVNTISQITAENPTIAVSIHKQNYTNEMIRKTKKFSVSILSEKADPMMIGKFGFFSSRNVDKFADVPHESWHELPILTENICGNLICELLQIVDVETHDIFIARVVDTKSYAKPLTPMTYRYYHEVIKGKAPKTAPTYKKENDSNETAEVDTEETASAELFVGTIPDHPEEPCQKYRCKICGHIYDEAIEKVRFCDLPDDWVCPTCGVGKEWFEKI